MRPPKILKWQKILDIKKDLKNSIKFINTISKFQYRISQENPPSVCLYTALNCHGDGGLCSATIADNASMLALGYGNAGIQVN
jgi:hypothetical protein